MPTNLPEDRAQAAFEAIGWMTSRESIRSQIDNGFPVLPRFSMATNPGAAAGSPIVRFIDHLARRRLLDTWQRPAIPGYTRLEAILGEEIHDALRGVTSDVNALANAQYRIESALASRTTRHEVPSIANRT